MRARLLWLPGLALLLLAGSAASAAEPTAANAQALAAKIDQLLTQRWAEANVEPAPPADDAEFVRRVYLDLAGRIPSAAETRVFLADTRADRRARLVEQLLAGPRFAMHFAGVWRALLIPEAGNNFIVRLQQGSFEGWLKERVARNQGYDELVRDLVTATIPSGNQALAAAFTGGGTSPLAFYAAKEFKAENLAASTARIFLGASVECAQCHNHPFSDWKREQFWEFAAFYSGIRSQQQMDVIVPQAEVADQKEIAIPGTDKKVQAKFLDGKNPTWPTEKGKAKSRVTMAEWLTAKENPYFARAAVNRLWAYFYGTGLIEPVDEVVGAATTRHPELFDLLAREFAEHKFDVKYLIRAITATRAYQLTSAARSQADDPALYARMPLRGLTPEQLFDSVVTATGFRDSGGGDDLRSFVTGGSKSGRSEFVTKFANPAERPVDASTSILQALTLMNGKVIGDATSLARSETLAAVVDAPFATTADRVETLYLATLSRRPTNTELGRAVRFIEGTAGQREALADVFWALLNTSEFKLNH